MLQYLSDIFAHDHFNNKAVVESSSGTVKTFV